MATAQELLNYSDSLTKSANIINDKANDPSLVFSDAKAVHDKAWAIAQQAWKITNLAIDQLDADVAIEIQNLTTTNDAATAYIKKINNFQSMLSVGAAILAVAAAVVSGNPLNSAPTVISLVTTINSTIAANG